MCNAPVTLVYVHNSLPTLAALCRVLPPHTPETPLLVVDDASTDGSGELLRSLAAENRLDLLQLGGTPHRTRALNAGFARAASVYPHRDVLRLHADTLPDVASETDALPFALQLGMALQALPGCGILGVRLVTPEGQILEQGRRMVCGLGLHAPDRSLQRWAADVAPATTSTIYAVDVDAVAGACALYAHPALEALRGLHGGMVLDEAYGPKGLEEEDACFAVRTLGFEVRVLPHLRAVHLGLIPPPEGADAPELQRRLERETRLREAQAELWLHKWGWDPLLPDMGEIRRLYGNTPAGRRVGSSLALGSGLPPAEALPAVDLCMVTWNGAAVLPRCLASLAATDYPPERLTLWIMDNASTDATPDILARFAETCPFAVRVERLAVNTGAVVGLNWAFAKGSAPLVAKLDDDIVVPPNWLRELAAVFRLRPQAGVVGPCVVDDSPAARVQCADFAYHPTPFSHELEEAEAQWPGLARVAHVRGCCNLYRRDVFARCGLLDLAYSPSQWDDPDHHMALLHEGYEVIYAGQVRVAHKCTLRARPTPASLTTGAMHKAAMLAKWGTQAPELLDCALLLSREGRFVTGPPPPMAATAPAPAAPDPALLAHVAARCARILEDEGGLSPVLPGLARQLRDTAAQSLTSGMFGKALGELRTALCCGAGDAGYARTLHALADLLEGLGAPNAVLRSRAALFAPACPQPEPLPPAPPMPQPVFTRSPVARNPIVTDTDGLHIAFCVPHALRFDADLHALLEHCAASLRARGHRVSLHAGPDRLEHAHIAHFWTFGHPHETLRHVRALRTIRPDLPLLLTPLWQEPDLSAALPALRRAVHAGLTPDTVLPAVAAPEGDAPLLRRRTLELLHGLLPLSDREAQSLGLPSGGLTLPLPGLPLPLPATPEAFQQAGGPAECILGVAPFHPAANQAVLLAALRAEAPQHPTVLPGAASDPWYLHACRRLRPETLFVDNLPPDLLASALAGARLLALPSLEAPWSASARLACNALRLGIPVVCAQGAPVAELTGTGQSGTGQAGLGRGGVFPCQPTSVPDVRRAVRAALAASRPVRHPADHPESHPSPEPDVADTLLPCYARLRG